MEQERLERWVKASVGVGLHGELMRVQAMHVVQGLGRLDLQLREVDKIIVATVAASAGREGLFLDQQTTLSYLWVLGAYEVVRTLDQAVRPPATKLPSPFPDRVRAVKLKFERLRIPLAKMEPAKKHPTDSPIAFPGVHQSEGIGWQVAADVFITRRELADAMLDLFCDIDTHRRSEP